MHRLYLRLAAKAIVCIMLAMPSYAQTTHTFGALDVQNIWTNNNSFFRLIPPHGPVAGEPPLPLLWTVYVVTDGASGSDCTVGGGTDQHWCGWTGVAWVPLGGTGGGGGGATPCGVVNDVQKTDGNGNFDCDSGFFQELSDTHTVLDWVGDFAQQVQISDAAHTGLIDIGHSNSAVVDAHFKISLGSGFSTTNSGYGINIPNSPSINKPLCITSLTPDGNGLLPSDWCSNVSTSIPFNDITSGTNTAATMVVGAGASLAPTSATAGVVSANQLNGTALSGLPTGILRNTTTTGVPTSSELSGAVTTSGSNVTTLAATYRWHSCTGIGLGDYVNAITAATYPVFGCVNNSGATMTLTGIHCHTDNSGTSTLDVKNNSGTSFLTGVITCTSTKSAGGAAGTLGSTVTLANGDALNFVFISDGLTQGTTWSVDVTLP